MVLRGRRVRRNRFAALQTTIADTLTLRRGARSAWRWRPGCGWSGPPVAGARRMIMILLRVLFSSFRRTESRVRPARVLGCAPLGAASRIQKCEEDREPMQALL